MNVLFFLEAADVRGGIEVYADRHAARLRADGNSVEFCHALPDADSEAEFFAKFDAIVVHKCPDVATLERFPPEKTTYFVHDHEPICPRTYAYTPLLNNCSRPGGIWPCILCAGACKRPIPALRRVLSQSRRKRAMMRLREIAVISNFMKSRLVANGLDPAKIKIHPYNPLEGMEPKAQPGVRGAPVPADIDMLFAGQLIRGKGVQLLLQAMARMKTPRTLDVVGSGNMEGRLKALAAELGVADRIRWRGFQPDAREWMAAAKTVVVPSFWQEPFGLVAAEAVERGREVVAFAIGGLPESCLGRGTLVPPGDVDALAAALDRPGVKGGSQGGKVKVFVFVDALGWRQVVKYGFLRDLLPYRRKIEMQFGYSCTAIPTILTGVRPDVHGHLAFYDYAPEKSPFKAMRYLAPLLKPDSFWRRGRVRNLLSKLVKRFYGFTGYFQLYGVPVERLPRLDYCEKRDIFAPGGLAPVKNLADVWTEQGHAWHISDWRLSEDENFRAARDLLRAGKVDRAFVYSAAFDALEHDNPGIDEVLAPKVERYAESIRSIHAALVESGRPFELTVISDHGMTPLRGTVDAPAAIAATGLKWGEDYASAIDSTMARFWWLKPGAREKVKAAFAAFPGRWLTEDEARRHGIWRDDRKFGDDIFLADAGVQFCPSDMGVKPLNGMHGFDPADADSDAAFLSTAPVPDGVSRVCDYFRVMTA